MAKKFGAGFGAGFESHSRSDEWPLEDRDHLKRDTTWHEKIDRESQRLAIGKSEEWPQNIL
jgi:hypothetical protein